MRRVLVFLALAGAAGVALAQTPAPQPAQAWGGRAMVMRMQRMEQWRLHQLTVLLDLSAAQQQQVKAIIEQQHATMRASMEQVMRAMREARQAHLAARREMMAKMARVLSAAQMEKFKVLVPPHPKFWMHRMGRPGMGMGMGPRGMGAPGSPPPPGPPSH